MAKKSKERRQFDNMKRRKGFYNYFGGKDKQREVHHKKRLSKGGLNIFSNFVYILSFAHRLLHKLTDREEMSECDWGNAKKPSIEKTYDVIADALIEKTRQNLYSECVKEEMRGR